MATVVKTRTYATAGSLTASNYNDDRDEIIAGINSINNSQIAADAAIAYSKLNLSGSILNADLAGSIAASKISNTAATLSDTQTLTNKTLTSPTLTTPTVNIGSDAAGDLLYRASGGGLARLAIGAAGQVLGISGGLPAWGSALTSKVGTFTRDMTASNGNVAYTGVGFQPTVLIVFSQVDGITSMSVGFVDSSGTDQSILQNSGGTMETTASLIGIVPSVGVNHIGSFSSFDSDGFTISWAKTGSPTGTINCIYLAMK